MTLQNIRLTNLTNFNETTFSQTVSLNRGRKFSIGQILGGNSEPTQKQMEAREKLYQLVASNGINYGNAKNNVEEIEKKYGDDCKSYYHQEQPKDKMIYIPPKSGFDATKIPDQKDKDRYYASIRAMQEIEKNYSALFAETGLKATVLNDIANRTNKPIFDFNW